MIVKTNPAESAVVIHLRPAWEVVGEMPGWLSTPSRTGAPSADAPGVPEAPAPVTKAGSLSAAGTDVQNAISYVQTADGFLGGMSGVLSRMGDLATLAQDPATSPGEVQDYQQEFQALQQQLRDTIGGGAGASPIGTFNGIPLFGSNPDGLSVSVDAGKTVSIGQTDLQDPSSALGSLLAQTNPPAFDVTATSANAAAAISHGIGQISAERAVLGAAQSQLANAAEEIASRGVNPPAAIPQIGDTQAAAGSTRIAKESILAQPETVMAAQANQIPQSVLKLLQ